MADNRARAKDPRSVSRNSEESLHTSRGINGDDGHSHTTKTSAKRNYKLLIDPAIKKGHQKIYRFDGIFPGQPPVVPRDPRPPRTKLWTASVADLPIPRFKVDKYYVGALPQNTIRFGCLNDNINRQFLRELCSKFGKIEECKVYYDIKSKKHLGTGKITFSCASAARQAVSELDGTSVMGNIIRVSIERKNNAQAKPSLSSKDPREFRDPRRSNSVGSSQPVLPTPSPSQYSPSVESTPPTPLIGSMSRAQPVAGLRIGLYGRRGSSVETDATPLESPASICSASLNSATFEPISPPPVSRYRASSNDSTSFPPPPPPDKASSVPPPPPPTKQEIYEDISPTANFDDDSKSPSSDKRKHGRNKNVKSGKETFVQAHLLGLKIACGVENCKKRDISDGHKHASVKPHKAQSNYESPNHESEKGSVYAKKEEKHSTSSREVFISEKNVSSHVPNNSSRKTSGSGGSKDRGRSGSPYSREASNIGLKASVETSDSKLARRRDSGQDTGKPQNESVYEAISDSDEDDKEKRNEINNFAAKNLHVEDISPANSPVTRNSMNGPTTKELLAADSAIEAVASADAKDTAKAENEMDIDDDDDDAMSLSSISSNEESELVLNTPVTRMQVQLPVASSSGSVSFSHLNVFATARPGINLARPPGPPANVVAPPPVNLSAPPPVNVAPPPQMNMPPVNVHQPPMNVQQTTMIARIPPPPPVNIHVPPPGHPFNQALPQPHAQQQQHLPPYGPPPGPPPPARQSQPLSTYPPQSGAGGFIGSYSRPYSGFFPGNYPNYPKHKQERPAAAIVKEIPYEEKLRNSCTLRTKKDLKLVLHRDLIKRLVEHSGFSALEAWWDNQTKKKDNSLSSSRSAATSSTYTSPLTQPQVDSPANSTTSSLLSSLFRRSHQPPLSASFASPTSSHTPVAKIPSFRINRIPQARPVTREPAAKRFKKEAQAHDYEAVNKVRRVEEFSDEERTVKEEESESESDSEVERTLLASKRATVQSGSSLYQSIYKSSSDEEVSADEDKSMESDEDEEDDEEEKFQDLISKQKLMSKITKEKPEEDRMSVEEDETVSDEEDEEEEAEESEDEEEEVTDDKAEDEESMDEEESEWESSGAEEVVKEVMKETEKRLEQFKEKSAKKQDQEKKLKEHEIMMVEYLKRRNDHLKKDQDEINAQDTNKVVDRGMVVEQNKDVLRNDKFQIKTEPKYSDNDQVLTEIDQLNKENIRQSKVTDGLIKGKKGKKFTEIVEETIEETQISTKVSSDLVTTEIKEELISEEVIEEIEPDEETVNEEVFNEHSYAFKTSFKKEDDNFKDELPSPIIDVVDDEEIKDFFHKEPEPKPVFPMRSIEDEKSIVLDILRQGIDNEDLKYLKSAFESLHGFGSSVVKDLHWAHHPETQIQAKQKRSKGEAVLRVHKTGCARSEGYYKIPYSEKAQYLSSVMRHLEAMDEKVEKDADGLKHKQQSRDNRAMQRRLVSSFVNDDFGDLVKFNKLKTRKKNLKFAKSGIHNWGLFTCEPIAAEEMVIEYVGESVRSIIADSREKHYEQRGIGSSYMFRLDAETVIDATKVGNNARFINHSCTPNCYAKIINVENEKKIVIYSKGDIKMNDEITYDYKFPIEEDKIECLCGTPQCRGTLN